VNDPDERNNLIEDQAQKGRISEMSQAMEDWFKEYVDPHRDGLKYDVSGSGQMRPVGKEWDSEVEPFA
jgi:hypothetical protein